MSPGYHRGPRFSLTALRVWLLSSWLPGGCSLADILPEFQGRKGGQMRESVLFRKPSQKPHQCLLPGGHTAVPSCKSAWEGGCFGWGIAP